MHLVTNAEETTTERPTVIINQINGELARAAAPESWQHRHLNAWARPYGQSLSERRAVAMCSAIRAWADIADNHLRAYDSPIGDDGVLGPAWQKIGDGLLDLLNGECGALDAGTLDRMIRAVLRSQRAESEE